jgi:small-conductance mechanosensitive channel
VDSFDNISVVVPNAEFANQRIVNWSHSDRIIRTNLSVGVAYGSDTELVKKTLLAVAESHPKVLKQRAPSVIFEGFGDSSLNFKLFVWIDEPESRLAILSDLYFTVDRQFRELKIEIPFPQRDLHIRSSAVSAMKP